MCTVSKEIELKRAERVHLGVDELNYGVSWGVGARVFFRRRIIRGEKWTSLNRLAWRPEETCLVSAAAETLDPTFPVLSPSPPPPHPPEKVVTDRATTLNFAPDLSGDIYIFFFYLTPIQINFHSGKRRLHLFLLEPRSPFPYAGCLSVFIPPAPSHRGWLHRGTQGYQLIFPQTDSVAPVWRLTTQSLKVALKPVLTISDPVVFCFFFLSVGFQSLGN